MFIRNSFLYICGMIFMLSLTINGYPSDINDERCLTYCFNNGICVINDNIPQCYCLPEWEGERCDLIRQSDDNQNQEKSFEQTKINNLRTHPCQVFTTPLCSNGGLCQFENNKYYCACPPSHIGKRCEIPSPCDGYCKNGLCTVNNESNPNCNCNGTNFDGLLCHLPKTTIPPPPENTTTTTTTPNPLCEAYAEFCNGAPCVINNGAPACQCPPTHQGPFCDIPVVGPPTTLPPVNTPPIGQPGTTQPGQPGTTQPGQPGTTQPGQPGTTQPGQPNKPIVGRSCADNLCQNGVRCFNTGNTYFCYCGTQFTGAHCETRLGG